MAAQTPSRNAPGLAGSAAQVGGRNPGRTTVVELPEQLSDAKLSVVTVSPRHDTTKMLPVAFCRHAPDG